MGPFASGTDVQLTFNADQDYWPIWTEDGHGILYAYVDPDSPMHRCVGLLPPAGGTLSWHMCHNSFAYNDSSTSFTGYALGADSRLIYTDAVSPYVPGIPAASQAAPYETTLWLADSAAPFARTPLLTLPTFVDGSSISWLSDIAWTSATTFIALGQDYAIVRHCFGTGFPADPACDFSDTVFSTSSTDLAHSAGVVIRGTIANGLATLHAVPGTVGATGYSQAEAGATIVFTKRDDPVLYKVPSAGGAVTPVGLVPDSAIAGYQLLGVSCKGTTCVVAGDVVTLTRLSPSKIFPVLTPGVRELRSVSLATGTSTPIRSYPGIVSSLQISPLTSDVVLQTDGMWGHSQTYEGSIPSDLHLLAGIVH